MLVRVWITRDGTPVPLNRMTESHIVNCIRKIERSRNWRKAWLEPLRLELEIRSLLRKG